MKFLPLLFLSFSITGSVSLSAEKYEDPSDLYYTGYLLVQEIKALEEKNQTLEALSRANEAFSSYKKLVLDHPDFHPKLVFARLQLIASKQKELRDNQRRIEEKEIEKMMEQLEKSKEGLEKLEGDLEILIVPSP